MPNPNEPSLHFTLRPNETYQNFSKSSPMYKVKKYVQNIKYVSP